ncbi:MAG TPA: hypothetical protein VHV78_01045, partial [Gemmatimonadaceae bacterium]|nr:hypothetical protein [Gemmatimonadaceae bacterium]
MRLHPIFVLSTILIAGAACGRRQTPASSAPAPAQAGGVDDAALIARARAIHQRVITIDTHKDIPDNFATPAADPKTMPGQVNLDKMKAG